MMRHDKEAFAREAIEAAHGSKAVGDYPRLLLFTGHARSLPWGTDRTRDLLDPFTGCFISRIPVTVVFLRLALKAASLFATGDGENARDGSELLRVGVHQWGPMVRKIAEDPEPLLADCLREREGWSTFYGILDAVENALAEGDRFAADLQKQARRALERCHLQLPG